MISGYTRGDRIPDFQRPAAGGAPVFFYDLQAGLPVLLLVIENPQAAGVREVLAALAQHADLGASRCTRVLLLRASAAECAALAGADSHGMKWLADDGQVMQGLLGPVASGRGPASALLLDSNMRVIERLEYTPQQDALAFLQRVAGVYAGMGSYEPQIRTQQAPVLFIPRVLEHSVCAELIGYYSQQGGKPSGTAYVEGNKAYWKLDPAVKMRSDVYLQEPALLERIKELLVRRLLPEIQRCFNYRVTKHEVFKLSCYDSGAGGYFHLHRDNESTDTRHRRFAMTLNLNTGDYVGGQLRLPEYGPDLYQPGRGDAVVFSSSLLHEVVPVTQGKRYVLIGFFFGEDQQMAPVEYVPGQ